MANHIDKQIEKLAEEVKGTDDLQTRAILLLAQQVGRIAAAIEIASVEIAPGRTGIRTVKSDG